MISYDDDVVKTAEASSPATIRDAVQEGFHSLIGEQQLIQKEYRIRKRTYDVKSVHTSDVQEESTKGWTVQHEGQRKTRVTRPKRHDRLLEDRAWCLFFKMGYSVMNAHGFRISFERDNGSIGAKQIDVYAEDGETALIVECKSRKELGRRSLQKDIQETISLKADLRTQIQSRFNAAGKSKPKIIWIFVTNNIRWSEPDIQRASNDDIKIITENEFQYYETFLRHMGPAGRYQILGDFLKGQKIPGLGDVKLPAIRGKIGGDTYYSFVATPRSLLKIAFVNHQALNHPDGGPAYQRMVSSPRIKEIGDYIKGGGYFPTNILVNFTESLRFDHMSNKENTNQEIKFGWVTLPTKYRSAWIIDGQHRLFGFSHLNEKYLDQDLFVLGFEKMSTEKEADLFITINNKQKSVPRSLLLSVLPSIHTRIHDPSTAISALGSAIITILNTDLTSPFLRRFAVPGIPAEPTQNLTISEVVKGLKKSGLIGEYVRKDSTPKLGPLSGSTDKETIERATVVLKSYFTALRDANLERWEAGREAFISVNPGIRAHMNVIAEVVNYLSYKKSLNFLGMTADKMADQILEFCKPIFNYIGREPDYEIRKSFSRRFGEGGVKDYGYYLMLVLAMDHTDFGSDDFQRWREQSNSEQIDEINRFLMKLAERVTDYVIKTLKEIHGTHRLPSDEQAFWELGVQNERIRRNAYDSQQKDKMRRKAKEAYLNVLDLMDIVKQPNNWSHFEHVFNNPKPDERKGKKYYLSWIPTFNDLRNIAAHKNHLKMYTDEDLEFVEWLRSEISPKLPEA